ncbi:hypothetical protein [Cupriavidus pinatubonensis]|uniref:hypothetical protein n=1 Tax=Cupriavidus pinatubonensis TaxID=248026 RepID=UPI0036071211
MSMALSMAHGAQEVLPFHSTRAACASGTYAGKSGAGCRFVNVAHESHKRLTESLGIIETSIHANAGFKAEYPHADDFPEGF